MIGGHGLRLSYGETTVLSDITLQLQAGSLHALIGANGSGKSTLLRCLAGLHAASAGTLLGAAALTLHERRRQLAMLPQSLPQAPALSVEQLALLGADAPQRWSASKQARQRAHEALELLDLLPLKNRLCQQLSGGEYRRACLAACFAQGSPWLLLDEPCAGLDLPHCAELMAGLKAWLGADPRRGALVVMHDLNLAAQWADRCLLLGEQSLLANDETDSVLAGDALEHAFGGALQRFRHPQADHLVLLGVSP
jgi:ABC-type cobalamin/Fe3+-siderophores transport system ATPase subunit